MQVSYGRLQAYAGMGFLSFAMIVLGSPIGNTGTWFGSMVMIGLGLWIELSDYYDEDDDSVLPRNIATEDAFWNAISLDMAMGGSSNTVLHILAVARDHILNPES